MNRKMEIGILLSRIILGLVFAVHGYLKFQGGLDKTAGFFSSLGLPGFMAYGVAVVELAGGLCLILGLGTRVIGALFAVIMLGAIFKVKLAKGFSGYELELALFGMAVSLVLTGSRYLALDSLLLPEREAAPKAA
ncbi:DoxX family protein [Paenibacillus aurantius]|uniref:DoxX family protein n=1 Tax=Paenibacillus aurantius TaxID=2918900 RepID=A0AA96RDQ8_9BACL|nr:DoxX family protein [Paenibacillus aurantius]WNQ10032.1 DoxX family protein [Paenibacillus aurantius]